MNVVLFQPEIPANTGNVARLCVISNCRLHLIRPLGFFLDDRHLKRAGLDYWEHLDLIIHDSWDAFLAFRQDKGVLFFVETGGTRQYCDVTYAKQDYLIFGGETKGTPEELLQASPDTHISLPMVGTRSLNLSNTVAITVYEAWRQLGFYGHS